MSLARSLSRKDSITDVKALNWEANKPHYENSLLQPTGLHAPYLRISKSPIVSILEKRPVEIQILVHPVSPFPYQLDHLPFLVFLDHWCDVPNTYTLQMWENFERNFCSLFYGLDSFPLNPSSVLATSGAEVCVATFGTAVEA